MKKINLKTCLYLLIVLALTACSSDPRVTELSPSSDPQVELEKVNDNLKHARNRQVDILSPKNFERAEMARDKAISARSNNKDQKTILHNLAVAQSYIDQANSTASIGEQIVKAPLEARRAAVMARAQSNFNKEINHADGEFIDLTKKIENNSTDISENKKSQIELMYRDLEGQSIKKDKLGIAKSNLEQAFKEGAKKLTPETLALTEKQIANEEAIIDTLHGDSEAMNQASARATVASERLLRIVRIAKTSSATVPEELAKQTEKNDRESARADRNLTQVEMELTQTKDRLKNQSERTQDLESQAWLDREYEAAMNNFTKDEAEVYKQGNRLILRLKGLAFANNKSEIPERNTTLLEKVKKVIGDVDASQVVIEGHTDSLGAKAVNTALSERRAKAVESFLTADKAIDAAKITTDAFGDTKPISSNKTAAGRAQNRRVDVVISAEPITE